MNRREFIGGLVIGLIAGGAGNIGQYIVTRKTQAHHGLSVVVDPYTNSESSMFIIKITNQGDVAEHNIQGDVTLYGRGEAIDSELTSKHTEPFIIYDDVQVNTDDGNATDTVAINRFSIPRLTPGDWVSLAFTGTKPAGEVKVTAQSDDDSSQFDWWSPDLKP